MKVAKVSVTQEHIDRGVTHSCSSCPVALALRDLGQEWSYLVSCASLHNICGEKVGTLPSIAIAFINGFDHGHAAQPFEFYVQID